MKAKEEYSIRLEMAEMHEEYIERMCEAYDNKYYVEAVWFSYAIFEQRISRLISKYIDQCNLFPERTDNKSAAISTRITCIKRMIESKHYGFDAMELTLFCRIKEWCDNRNELVHGLISLRHYKQYEDEFERLAKEGIALVFELYDACTNYRNIWYKINEEPTTFPMKKCNCKSKKCINPNNL